MDIGQNGSVEHFVAIQKRQGQNPEMEKSKIALELSLNAFDVLRQMI